MKNYILTLLLLGLLFSCTDQPDTLQESPTSSMTMTIESETSDSKTLDDPQKAFESAYKVVEKMPLFRGCEDKRCSDTELIRYIQTNLTYPAQAKAASIQGKVYIQFIIEVDGSVSNVFIARDLGFGTGAQAKAVVEKINDLKQGWTAGEQNGQKVPVMYTLPVSFMLE